MTSPNLHPNPDVQHAWTALSVPLRYTQSGRNLAWAALAGARQCVTLAHYPCQDVIDQQAASRYFYHAHESRKRPLQEHGHFHLFVTDPHQGHYSHLAGLSLDARGQPLRWFTTNQWVTGEHWLSAPQLAERLAQFQIQTRGRLAPVAQWLTAMVQLFRADLAQLIERRDHMLEQRLRHASREAIFEDRRLDVMSQSRIFLDKRLAPLISQPTPKEERHP